jgi:hypothetical protein
MFLDIERKTFMKLNLFLAEIVLNEKVKKEREREWIRVFESKQVREKICRYCENYNDSVKFD